MSAGQPWDESARKGGFQRRIAVIRSDQRCSNSQNEPGGSKRRVFAGVQLSRWGRSTQDLLDTLHRLAGWKVSVVAMSGMTFELDTPHGA